MGVLVLLSWKVDWCWCFLAREIGGTEATTNGVCDDGL